MNTKNILPPVSHPGATLKEGLNDLGISQYRLGKDLHIPHSTITGIIKGRQSITVPIALKFGKYFGTSPEYWLNLQRQHDMEIEEDRIAEELMRIHPAPELATAY